MREKFMRFMAGRYGVDRLSKHMIVGALILSILSMGVPTDLLYALSMVLIVLGYFRIFSRNHSARYKETCAYERFLGKIKSFPARMKNRAAQSKDYKIFKCPNCKQKLRVPRGKGTVEVRCKKCSTVFRGRT